MVLGERWASRATAETVDWTGNINTGCRNGKTGDEAIIVQWYRFPLDEKTLPQQ